MVSLHPLRDVLVERCELGIAAPDRHFLRRGDPGQHRPGDRRERGRPTPRIRFVLHRDPLLLPFAALFRQGLHATGCRSSLRTMTLAPGRPAAGSPCQSARIRCQIVSSTGMPSRSFLARVRAVPSPGARMSSIIPSWPLRRCWRNSPSLASRSSLEIQRSRSKAMKTTHPDVTRGLHLHLARGEPAGQDCGERVEGEGHRRPLPEAGRQEPIGAGLQRLDDLGGIGRRISVEADRAGDRELPAGERGLLDFRP